MRQAPNAVVHAAHDGATKSVSIERVIKVPTGLCAVQSSADTDDRAEAETTTTEAAIGASARAQS